MLASFTEPLEFLASTSFARLLVISLATHLFAKSTPLAEFAEPTNGLLNRLTSANP